MASMSSSLLLRRLLLCCILLTSLLVFQTSSSLPGGDEEEHDDGIVQAPVQNKQSLEFVHITKTGGTAVEQAGATAGFTWGVCHWEARASIGRACQRPNWKTTKRRTSLSFEGEWWHTPPAWLSPNPYGATHSFTIVRNPYERIISEYYCKYFGYHKQEYVGLVDRGVEQQQQRKRRVGAGQWGPSQRLDRREKIRSQLLERKQQRRGAGRRLLQGFGFGRSSLVKDRLQAIRQRKAPNRAALPRKDSPSTLNGWIRKLLQQGQLNRTGHALPQHLYVYDEKGNQVVTHILRFESLQAEFEALMQDYGLGHVQLAKANAGHESSSIDRMTVEDLQPSTIEMINKFYAQDFEHFGYEMITPVEE